MAIEWDDYGYSGYVDSSTEQVNYDGFGNTTLFVCKQDDAFWICNGRYHNFPPESRIIGPFPTLDTAKLAAELMFE